jgi:RNA polymerase sigma-70 factor (ECF subfamily)
MSNPKEQTFEEIVAAYYEPLYRFGLSLTQRTAEASDLVQETFFSGRAKGINCVTRQR